MPMLAHLFPPRFTEKRPGSPRRKRSAADLRRFVTTFLPNMNTNVAVNHNPFPSLNLLVLLPSAAHLHQLPAPPYRPSALSSRKSSSTIPSLQSIKAGEPVTSPSSSLASSTSTTKNAEEGSNNSSVMTSRRLSLAPGLGAGATLPSAYMDLENLSPHSSPAPTSYQMSPSASSEKRDYPFGSGSGSVPAPRSPQPSSATSSTQTSPITTNVPAFGARRSTGTGTSRLSRRRPVTASTSTGIASTISPALMGIPGGRASLAVPPGLGGVSHSNRTRPGWEADEVIGTLRGSGMEVTVIRHAEHLPQVLNPSHQPSFQAHSIVRSNDTADSLTQVVLIPLSDSPAFPSLSLLLQQGTTPTAVCFQQDLLERAKRSEDEWLPGALAQIRSISKIQEKIDRDSSDSASSSKSTSSRSSHKQPIIIAYSANPALSQTTINACLSAGAAGVLKPPYELDTAELVMQIINSYREGKPLSTVSSPSLGRTPSPLLTSRSPLGSPTTEGTTVILPPTALDMGAEHEGERVLGAHRKSLSGSWTTEPPRRASVPGPARKASLPTSNGTLSPRLPTTPKSSFPPLPLDFSLPQQFQLHQYNSECNPRRRSVDVGGLSLALKRASLAFEETFNQPIGTTLSQIKEGYSFPPSTPVKSNLGGSYKSSAPGSAVAVKAVSETDSEGEGTELAELLSAMFCHTMTTIEVQMSDYEALSAPLTQNHRERLVQNLSTWNFKPHNLPEGDLYRVACLMFESVLSSEGIKELNIQRDQINRLLFAIRAIYHAPNPYHNYVHAIDVLQATYMFLTQIGVAPPFSYMRDWTPGKPAWQRSDPSDREISVGTRRAREVMRPQDVLGVLIAAMGHDVGHPGLSNAFMKNAKVPLSQVYEDKSVLENMHCMLIVQLLRKHGFGFLIEGPQSSITHQLDQKGFRRVLYSTVLATDMSLHFAWIQRLKEFDEGLREGEVGEDEYDRVMVCQALIKCADISNPTRPIDVSQHWSSVLLEEWAKQASLESDLDLPVSVVASADAALQAKGQIGFIDLFTLPLFEAVSEALPELQVYADSCSDNRDVWQRRLDLLNNPPSPPPDSDEQQQQIEVDKQIIQPLIEGASHDERFKTLFPLLLPTSLISNMSLVSSSEENNNYYSNSLPTTPPTPTSLIDNKEFSQNQEQQQQQQQQQIPQSVPHPDSPAAKAIRTVYKAKLAEQIPKGRVTSSSWARSLSEWNEGRRMSTPEVVVSRDDFST
ncbi:uncharacterized protein I206_103624 [Kwoniella pini CBS 10737]|uniref:Phosphodiesterase n=1 Tax=Kwoniella pini CBS 10737 TaxID=1296096 RepID=A0A1B9I975_9TREE|nr:uncharacterized protein I206_01374 [Kwoniella pini CBS 10737]OCF52089.1 hypothetical protein I206_01374 [Kwoniella pini CBS 10737]